MTISTDVSKVAYAADGSTATFVVSFYFLEDSHLVVYLKSPGGGVTTAVLNSDYTVSGAGNVAGGSITFTTAPAAGFTVTIVRDVPATQETAYQENDPFPAKTHERALDKLTMLAQQNISDIDRAIKLNVTDPAGTNVELPVAALRANKALIFGASGEVTVSVGNFDDAGVYADNAATSAAAALVSETNAAASLASFLNIYLGSFAADPTLTPTGGALTAGDLYWNTASSRLRIYNGTSWQDSATATPSSFTANTFSGNGSTTAFTLSTTPASSQSVLVFISGVAQRPGTDFTVSGTTLTISPAPASGTNNILAIVASTVAVGVPDNDSVSTAKIQNSAVTAAKMAAGAAASNLGFTPVNKAGDTMTGAFNEAATVTLASAGTVNIGAAAANTISITGTTTITSFGTIAAGAMRRLIFSGALTLTHNATSLILPGGANITTAAGDVAEFVSLGSGNWRCINYVKADGTALVAASAGGMTLLGTLTTTSGTTQTLSGLNLTGYRNLFIVAKGVSHNNTGNTQALRIIDPSSTAISIRASDSNTELVYGQWTINLSTGVMTGTSSVGTGAVGQITNSGGTNISVTTFSTSTTSITFNYPSGSTSFDGGSIEIYGVK